MGITGKQAEARIVELRKELEVHNRNYYVLNAPVISDFEYDLLMQELMSLEKMFPDLSISESPSQKVGSDLSSGGRSFKQYEHRFPMLSLGNTYNADELVEFDSRIEGMTRMAPEYNCELKFDGTAICLTYEKGTLVRALTRGDGIKGDDVTANVLTIDSIPAHIGPVSFDFEIRGEIYMPFDAFDRLNAQRVEQEDAPFANPRNAASGSLKLLDPDEVRNRGLKCVLYHILGDNLPFTLHTEAVSWAAQHGFPVSEHSRICHTIDEVKNYIEEWDTKRRYLPFPTDGIVIKVNDLTLQKRLGFTAKTPRWATAFKFKPEEALTRVISFDYQVGRTGAVTPVANLEPVQLSGTVVKRATLHNFEQMELLDIRIDDWVYVEKGGEIIPKITRVETSRRSGDSIKPKYPSACPVCGMPLQKDEDEAKHYCLNQDGCPPQIIGRFVHFASRKAMNILLGDATAAQLYEKGYIKELQDLFKLTKNQLMSLDGWKDRSAERFLESLDKARAVPFHRVLFALGIRHVGESTAKMLASRFRTIDTLAAASIEELTSLDDIGDVLAVTIHEWFKDSRHQMTVESLREAGLIFEVDENEGKQLSDSLNGCKVVISGNFSIPRDEMKAKITSHGGRNTGSVSAGTTYLLAGEKAGPEKLRKAEKLGVKVIDEHEFYRIIGEESPIAASLF